MVILGKEASGQSGHLLTGGGSQAPPLYSKLVISELLV